VQYFTKKCRDSLHSAPLRRQWKECESRRECRGVFDFCNVHHPQLRHPVQRRHTISRLLPHDGLPLRHDQLLQATHSCHRFEEQRLLKQIEHCSSLIILYCHCQPHQVAGQTTEQLPQCRDGLERKRQAMNAQVFELKHPCCGPSHHVQRMHGLTLHAPNASIMLCPAERRDST
jgi:hypothetical protein